MILLNEFYQSCCMIADRSILPLTTDIPVYDPRFNEVEVIEEILKGNDPFLFDIPRYYHDIFMELYEYAGKNKPLIEVCDSDSINEPANRGDFIYYAGEINQLGILYMMPRNVFYYPYRAILYGLNYQFEIGQDWKEVKMFPVAHHIRNYIILSDIELRKYKVKEYLKETDRPIIPYYEALI